ncbi:dipeptide-binding ABC transporter, periplasmic substrate-binding component [Pseudonocardia sp. N23]|nr:dipeptide-binding ABC transporter, periplasmic substrate-binding component [Pseudonocardia sp. N23]
MTLDLHDLGTFSSKVVQGRNFQLSTWVSGWPRRSRRS